MAAAGGKQHCKLEEGVLGTIGCVLVTAACLRPTSERNSGYVRECAQDKDGKRGKPGQHHGSIHRIFCRPARNGEGGVRGVDGAC